MVAAGAAPHVKHSVLEGINILYIHTQRCWYVHTRVVHIDTHTRIVHIDTHNCQDRSFYTLTHCVCFLLYVIVCVCFRHACASVQRVQRVSDTLSRHVCEYTNPPFISLSLSLSLPPPPLQWALSRQGVEMDAHQREVAKLLSSACKTAKGRDLLRSIVRQRSSQRSLLDT